jgi:hypothetical protein
MTFKAHFDGKVVVLDEPVSLEPGTRVEVSVPEAVLGTRLPGGSLLVGRGLSGREIAKLVENDEAIWQDKPDSPEFARQLREQAAKPRYTIDPD